MKQRILSAATALLLCLSALAACIPPALAYTDVTDAAVEAVAVLAGMGIVDPSTAGSYQSDTILTRAELCRLAVLLQGKGDQATASAYRSLFSDVPSSGWAIGYVNLAYSEGLISGYGNGTFGPDDPATVAQAVTALLRVLGYSNSDIGPFWPEDYMTKAAKLGLTDGLTLSADASLTRGQAAVLFYHTLKSDTAQGKEYHSTWAASAVENTVLMDVDAQADDGRTGTAQVYAGGAITWYDQENAQSADLEGRRGTLLLDQSGKVVGFLPEDNSVQTIAVARVAADGLTDAAGGTYAIAGTVKALSSDHVGTYSTLWYDLENSGKAMVYYTDAGSIDLVYFLDGGRYAGTLLTGFYENAVPNSSAPTKITLLGVTLGVADGAKKTLSQFKVGERITVALDASGKVAAAYATTEKKADAVGILTSVSGDTAKVQLTSGLSASGTLTSGTSAAEALVGGLVKVNSSGVGKVSVYTLSGSAASGKWDIAAGTVGRVKTASGLQVYDQVGGIAATLVDTADLVTTAVAAEDITYVGRNSAGEIDLIVLSDVTGSCYTYGYLQSGSQSGGSGDMTYTNHTVAVKSSGGTSAVCLTGTQVRQDAAGGLAATSSGKVAGIVTLTSISGVARADFSGEEAVLAGGYLIPVSGGVEVYNQQTQAWTTLAEAKAFGDSFTIYYDKTPGEGGQVRLIEVDG